MGHAFSITEQASLAISASPPHASCLVLLPVQVCELPLCKVLLCDDAQYPCWCVCAVLSGDLAAYQFARAPSRLPHRPRPLGCAVPAPLLSNAPPAALARLVLVPRVNRVREVLELTEEQQAALWREVDAAARVIQVREG